MVQESIQSAPRDDDHHSWQLRLMPFMVGIILILALFFFGATLYQLYELNVKIQEAPELDSKEMLEVSDRGLTLMEKQWRSLVVLEAHILQQRYHQANVLLMARIWVRYLGFVTGMMLSMIGAVFILGKLREPTTELTLGNEGENQNLPSNLKVQLVTQSPGIVLVTLGTVLMLITILVHHSIEVNDAPVYTSVTAMGQSTGTTSKPADLRFNSSVKKGNTGNNDMKSLLDEARKRHGTDNEETSE